MYIKVRAYPQAKKEQVRQISETTLEVSVREKAERNRANRRIKELLKIHYQSDRVQFISGHRSTTKIFNVIDLQQ